MAPKPKGITPQSPPWVPKGAAAKLAYIQAHVGNPDKSGYNSFHKFAYVQEHSLIELLRPMLRDLHCLVLPSPAALEVRVEDGQTGKGKSQKLVTLVGELVFMDTDEPADSPDRSIVGRYTAAGSDDLDKAHAKAQTIFVKYALQKMFLVPTEHIEDGDADARPMAETEAVAEIERTFDAVEDVDLEVLGELFDASSWNNNDLIVALVSVGVEDTSKIGAAMESLDAGQRRQLANLLRGA